jgi:hypothetical protein
MQFLWRVSINSGGYKLSDTLAAVLSPSCRCCGGLPLGGSTGVTRSPRRHRGSRRKCAGERFADSEPCAAGMRWLQIQRLLSAKHATENKSPLLNRASAGSVVSAGKTATAGRAQQRESAFVAGRAPRPELRASVCCLLSPRRASSCGAEPSLGRVVPRQPARCRVKRSYTSERPATKPPRCQRS